MTHESRIIYRSLTEHSFTKILKKDIHDRYVIINYHAIFYLFFIFDSIIRFNLISRKES